jgi:hypothetical protein
MEDAAAKVVALKAKRDAWMSQRSAAMERENMRNEAGELVALDGGGGDGKANDDLVLDRITERITSRLREELRIEVTYRFLLPCSPGFPTALATQACGTRFRRVSAFLVEI